MSVCVGAEVEDHRKCELYTNIKKQKQNKSKSFVLVFLSKL